MKKRVFLLTLILGIFVFSSSVSAATYTYKGTSIVVPNADYDVDGMDWALLESLNFKYVTILMGDGTASSSLVFHNSPIISVSGQTATFESSTLYYNYNQGADNLNKTGTSVSISRKITSADTVFTMAPPPPEPVETPTVTGTTIATALPSLVAVIRAHGLTVFGVASMILVVILGILYLPRLVRYLAR